MTSPALLQVAVGGDRPYPITIGAGAQADGTALASHVRGRHVLCSATAKWPRAIWMP